MIWSRLLVLNARRTLLALLIAVSLTSAVAVVTAPLIRHALAVANIIATKVDAIQVDLDSDGRADGGDTIRYTVRLTNTTASNQTGVAFNDTIDANTEFVPGSLNVSPLAFDDSYDTIGNTLLKVGVAAGTDPEVVVAGGSLFNNDTEFLGDAFTLKSVEGVNFVAVSVTAATEQGGSVTVNANGSFSYTPPVGFSGVDNFDYVNTDDGVGGQNALSGAGRVTINVLSMVWYVKNNAAGGGLGRSTDPFDTLVEAQAASAVNHTIYVFTGDGTTTGQNAGIALKSGQRFVGEGVALTMPVSVNGGPNPTTLRAAGTHPRVDNTAGNGASATDVVPIEMVGLSLSGTQNAIDVTLTGGSGTGTLSIRNNIFFGAGLEGLDVNMGGTGTLNLDVLNNSWNTAGSHGGNGVDIQRTAGTLRTNFSTNTNVLSTGGGNAIVIGGGAVASTTVTGFSSNTVNPNSTGTGMNISNVTFDATPGSSYNQVSGGTTTIGASGNGVAGSGVLMTTVNGDLAFTDLDIYADSGTGLGVTGSGAVNVGAGTGTRVTVNAGVGTIEATGGPAVSLLNMTADLQLASLKSTNSTSTGVSLGSVLDGTTNSTVSAGSGSAILTALTTDFVITNSNAAVTYDGTITDDQGQLVSAASNTGDTIQFRGAITDGDDGDGSGVSLISNAGTTIRFEGGLVLSTGSNPAFAATGGAAAVEVCDESPCNPAATGALINKITTTTGTALNVASTTIGANDLEFRSISAGTAASGPTNGIVLNATGASGSLVVKGAGGACTSVATCTGGAIQKTTSHGILLTTTLDPSFSRMGIQNTSGSGVSGTDVTNFTYQDGFIDSSGTGLAVQTSNIAFNTVGSNNLDGVVVINNNTLTNAYFHGIDISNFAGTITSLDITGNTLTSSTTGGPAFPCGGSPTPATCSQGTAIRVLATGNASTSPNVNDATVSNNIITNFPLGAGITMLGSNAALGSPLLTFGIPNDASNIISITGNRIAGNSFANKMNTNAIQIGINGIARGNWEILNNGTVANPINNVGGNVISTSVLGNSTGTVVISGNRITAGHTPNFGGPIGISSGIGATFPGTGETPDMTITISNNNVSGTDGSGITARGAENVTGLMKVKISGNTVGAPVATALRSGIRVEAGGSTGDNDVCLDINSNTTAGSTDGFDTAPGISLRKQGTSTTVNAFGIEGMAATSSPGVETYVNGLNPGSASGTFGVGGTSLASATSGFSNCSSAP